MMRGLSFFTASYPSPRRSIVPGAMFSTVTSAFFKSSFTISSPRGDLRLIVSDFLLALNMWKYHGSSSGLPGRSRRPGSPVFGFSIFTTSAPSQASASVQDVPASNWVKSTTLIPVRQLKSWLFSFIVSPPESCAVRRDGNLSSEQALVNSAAMSPGKQIHQDPYEAVADLEANDVLHGRL